MRAFARLSLNMRVLFLICGTVLSPQAHSLTCNECDTLTECGGNQRTCSAQFPLCGVLRATIYKGEKLLIDNFQGSCYAADDCTEGSFTSEISQNFFKISCCNTDNCNTEKPPLPSVQTAPNGRKCYSCDDSGNCNKTMSCTGNETFCFYHNVPTLMGCATESLCVNPPFSVPRHMKGLQCCEGDFCNGNRTKKSTGNKNSSSGTRASLLPLTSTIICLFVFLLR